MLLILAASTVSVKAANPAFQDFATNQFSVTGNKVVMREGRTLYVDSRFGNNAAGGREEKPFRDIANAITNAQSGDTIIIRPGDYTNHSLVKAVASLTFRGEPGVTIYAGDTNTTVPMFHDRGLTYTNRWYGPIRFIQPGLASLIEQTNANTYLHIEGFDTLKHTYNHEQVAATMHVSGGRLEVKGYEIFNQEYDCYWLDAGVVLPRSHVRGHIIEADRWVAADNIVETSMATGSITNWGDVVIRGKVALPITNRAGPHIFFVAQDRMIIDFDTVYCDSQTLCISSINTSEPQGPSVRLGTVYMTNVAAPNGQAAVRMTGSGALTLRDTTIISSNAIVPIHAGNSLLTLQNVRVQTGAAFAISNNAAATVNVIGSFTANTNEHSNITFTSGGMGRRTTGGDWVTPSTGAIPGTNQMVFFNDLGVIGAVSTFRFNKIEGSLFISGTYTNLGNQETAGNGFFGNQLTVGNDAMIIETLSAKNVRGTNWAWFRGPLTNTTQVITGATTTKIWSVNNTQAMLTNGLFGIGKTPTVALDVSGAIAASGNINGAVITGTSVGAGPIDGAYFSTADAAFESLAADNQVIVAGRSYILVQSDNVTAGNRTFLLDPAPVAGMVLTLEWVGTNAGELVDNSASGGATVRLSATWTPTEHDTLSLRFNGGDWIETGRSTN